MPDITIKNNGTVIEGSVTTLSFTVQLSDVAQTATTYYWSTMDGSASSGTDFTAVTGNTLTFAIGEQTKTITVALINNALFEADEFLFLNVFSDVARTTQVASTLGLISDTWIADVTTSLSDAALINVDSLLLTGTADINGTGNTGANRITGNSGANLLSGLGGDDLLEGSAGVDTLQGALGNDTLDGGTGVDSLVGGGGNDLYVIDIATDVITGEQSGDGTDTVQSSVDYTLPGASAGVFLENLTLSGSAITGAGNEFFNVVTGNAAANNLSGNNGNDTLLGLGGIDTLKGGSGDDVLDGGTGANRLEGGLGNDVYRLNSSSETIVELAGEGSDRVEVALNYSIAATPNLENITLTGDTNINARGNASANVLTGNNSNNILWGGDGNDVLDGKGGLDTLRGQNGDDIYILAENPWNFIDLVEEGVSQGTDTVRVNADYTLPANIERLELLGDGGFLGTGNAGGNTLTGNSGNNLLQGLGGVDLLRGELGNDTLVLEDVGDQATEDTGEGTDTVIVAFATATAYTLADNNYIENITLQGTASKATGNVSSNGLLGNEGGDTLTGGAGDDTLDGGEGQDVLIGGTGRDVFRVNIADSDQIIEVAVPPSIFEIDTIILSDTGLAPVGYNMAPDVENLTYTGAADLNLLCNVSDNFIVTGPGKDTLLGGVGNDTLDGGLNADVMLGGVGDDIYRVSQDTDIATEVANEGLDIVESPISYRLGATTDVENLTLTGTAATTGHGNSLGNRITGNTGANILDGLAGNDNLSGGGGNDTLLGQAGNDSLRGESGIDLLQGQAGDDTLNGGGGAADTLIGGAGNDSYETDSGAVVIEGPGEGVDVVSSSSNYTLPDNAENLFLTGSAISGTGNALNNLIVGQTTLNNTVSNILDGGLGNDTLVGGNGNDFYYLDSVMDVVTEDSSALSGADLVFASVSGYTLAANVENLSLISTAVSGTGNSLKNRIVGNPLANSLDGGDGDDLIDGQAGSDNMVGGVGNDTFVVDNVGDSAVEASGAGTDTVLSELTLTLPANVENLSLTGVLPNNGTGNSLNNTIYGNDANNVLTGDVGNDILIGNGGADKLVGGNGNDTLTGGTGADRFDYVSAVIFSASTFGNDVIKDFSRSEGDKINLGKITFGFTSPVGASPAPGTEFLAVATEALVGGSTARVVYSQATGNLYFNPDGPTPGGDILIATIFPLADAIANTDIVIS